MKYIFWNKTNNDIILSILDRKLTGFAGIDKGIMNWNADWIALFD